MSWEPAQLPPPVVDEHAEQLRRLTVGQLTPWWRLALFWVWILTAGSVLAIVGTADLIGRHPSWQRGLQPFFVVAAVVVALFVTWRNHRLAPWVGAICALALGTIAAFDRDNAPGAALVLGIVAAAAFVGSLSCLAGRIRPRRTPAP